MNINDQLEKICRESLNQFVKIDDGKYSKIRSKIEYCLGSYGYDGNIIGLYESAKESSALFKKYIKKNPRKVAKKFIDSIDRTVLKYEKGIVTS